jgi:riboflavin transporter FmnP
LAIGTIIFIAALSALAFMLSVLDVRLPGYEPFIVLAVVAAAIVSCLLDFYVLLPAFSIYTFRLVETGRANSGQGCA